MDERPSLTPGSRLGDYEILAPIGAGGMGEVYRARDRTLGRDVAIKVLRRELAADAERLKRFEQEARSASALNHPNIVHIYAIGEEAGTRYIAMEYVEGRTLRDLLREAPLSTEEIKTIGSQIAAGLAKAHAAGIVHRDLKPENVMVTDEGYAKILDFGLAKLVGEHPTVDSEMVTRDQLKTQQGVIVGTVEYMSPEQAGGRVVDARSDQFSLGSILYEMATGERPFSRETFAQTMAAIIEDEPEPVTKLEPKASGELAAVVERCLKKAPGQRFESMSELSRELTSVSETGVLHRSRRSLLWVASGLVVAILGVAIGVNLDRLPRSATSSGIDSLVVLPVRNVSGDAEQEYLAAGMTESLIADLAKIGALRVISRTSAMTFKDSDKPLSEIASELDVDAVIEASVLRVGDRVRVTAQLIDVERDAALWAETYEREFRDLLLLESEVARAVAEAIQVTLTPDEATRLASARAVDPEAHEAYLKGRFHFQNETTESLDAAISYFQIALEKDPDYAPAYAGIARVWSARRQFGLSGSREATRAEKAAVEKALELDETLAEAHFCLAVSKAWGDWDWSSAGPSFERAIELDPKDPDTRAGYSHYLMITGRPAEAMAQIERALELDPLNVRNRAFYAIDLTFVHRYDDAMAVARDVRGLAPGNGLAHTAIHSSLYMKGMLDEAFEEQRSWFASRGDRKVEASLSAGYAEGGYTRAMKRAADTLASRGDSPRPMVVASLYALAGEKESTLEWLEKAFDSRDPNAAYLAAIPLYDPLRDEPGYQDLLRRMNLAP